MTEPTKCGPAAVDVAIVSVLDEAFHRCENPELKSFVDAVRFS